MTASNLHPTVAAVTERVVCRSAPSRRAYLDAMDRSRAGRKARTHLGCANVAHVVAAMGEDKPAILAARGPNLAIVTAYNDMLSAHQPFGTYPDLIKAAAREVGATAQVAGGVPAMCDGVTQGRPGMELSLFSRDVIALATAVALSHDVFDGVLLLGVCDKIVPGMLIGALQFGHLPAVFVPAGPMSSGLGNPEKAKVRERYTAGEISREELLEAESKAYHGPGTCTFYGTANSNQMLLEVMGLQLPGAAFVHPHTPLRTQLTRAATQQASALARGESGVGTQVDEKAIINAMVGLLATGGSTNHAIHLPAIARAAGIQVSWQDFSDLSSVTPLLAQIYPNGRADVNHFQAAGGIAFVVRELLDAGLLHGDIRTVMGSDLNAYASEPNLREGRLQWAPVSDTSLDRSVLRSANEPFRAEGGLTLVEGNLGRAIFKTSAVDASRWLIEAPARVFHSQEALQAAFRAGELERDVVVVVRFQGPEANGMPELHKLTPPLAVLQERGHKVALVTDGRMSGASGKVPAAIHVSPEAACGGPLAKVRDGDLIRLDARRGELTALVHAEVWQAREGVARDDSIQNETLGRQLFGLFRRNAGGAETGASALLACLSTQP